MVLGVKEPLLKAFDEAVRLFKRCSKVGAVDACVIRVERKHELFRMEWCGEDLWRLTERFGVSRDADQTEALVHLEDVLRRNENVDLTVVSSFAEPFTHDVVGISYTVSWNTPLSDCVATLNTYDQNAFEFVFASYPLDHRELQTAALSPQESETLPKFAACVTLLAGLMAHVFWCAVMPVGRHLIPMVARRVARELEVEIKLSESLMNEQELAQVVAGVQYLKKAMQRILVHDRRLNEFMLSLTSLGNALSKSRTVGYQVSNRRVLLCKVSELLEPWTFVCGMALKELAI